MHSFRDAENRLWEVAIHAGAIKRVKGLLGVNLYGLVGDGLKPLGQLLGDPGQLVDVLYALCRDQAEKAGVSDEQFGRALGGDSFGQAAEAFVEELIDFFPSPEGRARLRELLGKVKAGVALLGGLLEADLAKISPEQIAAALRRSSGSSPAPAASTPGPSPSPS